MSKYVLAYNGGAMGASPEEQEKAMEAWMGWFGSLGPAVLDAGNPFGPASTVASDGSVAEGGTSRADRLLDHRSRQPVGGGAECQGVPGPLERWVDRGLRGDADRMSGRS